MNDIVNKRNNLYNFFLNDISEFNKKDILRKEFSVLSFSPREEYIDSIQTEFDNICIDLNILDIEENVDDIYIKGIIIDIDNKTDYSIIHIQNKNINISITCSEAIVYRYNYYFNTGDIIITKCHIYNEKIYMDFLIDIDYIEDFINECKYIRGELIDDIEDEYEDITSKNKKGLIHQITYFKSQKGKRCARIKVQTIEGIHSYISCKNIYNPILPSNLVAGDIINFTKGKDVFISNVKKIIL